MDIPITLYLENRAIEELYEAYRKAKNELISALMAENVAVKQEQPN